MNTALTGYLLKLDSSSWGKIEKRARNAVRKAKLHLEVKEGTIEELRSLHWNPVYLPWKPNSNQRIFTATLNGRPVASILITLDPDRRIIKYVHAGSDKKHEKHGGNSLLLWWLVEKFQGEYDYLDLGGSVKKGISFFKRQFATETYTYKRRRNLFSRFKFRLSKWLPYNIRKITGRMSHGS